MHPFKPAKTYKLPNRKARKEHKGGKALNRYATLQTYSQLQQSIEGRNKLEKKILKRILQNKVYIGTYQKVVMVLKIYVAWAHNEYDTPARCNF